MVTSRELLEVACDAAKRAGELLKNGFGTHFAIKEKPGRHNLVTEYDTLSEREIISTVLQRFPTHSTLAEEGGAHDQGGSDYLWIIDPLDGTVNFAHGIPIFSVSIACAFQKEVVAAVVYQPMTGELFTAEKGKGAKLNGNPICVSRTEQLKSAFLVTGFPYNVEENPHHCIEAFTALAKLGVPLRRLGSAALDLCYVAAGRFDGFWEVFLEPWDLAAGKRILEEAGGQVSHYDGSAHTLFEKGTMLATNRSLHNSLQRILYGASTDL